MCSSKIITVSSGIFEALSKTVDILSTLGNDARILVALHFKISPVTSVTVALVDE